MLKRNLMATLLMVAVIPSMAAAKASDRFSTGCLAPVAPFQNGLLNMQDMKGAVSKEMLQKIVVEYDNLIKATAQSQTCFQSALNLTKASRNASRSGPVSSRLAQLQRGVNEVGRVFKLGHTQFKALFENGMAENMARLAPAAGPDTMAADDNDTMLWIDTGESLLANSDEITLRQSGLKYLARQSH